MTRTALAGWAGLVCTLTTACLSQYVYRSKLIAVRRIEVPTGPVPDATLKPFGTSSLRAFSLRDPATRSLPCRLAVGRSSWRRETLGHVPTRSQLFRGQKQNPRRSDDSLTSVRVYRNACCGYKCASRNIFNSVAKVCNPVQLLAGVKVVHSRTWGEKRLFGQDGGSLRPLNLPYRLSDQGFGGLGASSPPPKGLKPRLVYRD